MPPPSVASQDFYRRLRRLTRKHLPRRNGTLKTVSLLSKDDTGINGRTSHPGRRRYRPYCLNLPLEVPRATRKHPQRSRQVTRHRLQVQFLRASASLKRRRLYSIKSKKLLLHLSETKSLMRRRRSGQDWPPEASVSRGVCLG